MQPPTHPASPAASERSSGGMALLMSAVCLGMAALTAGLLRHHYTGEIAYWRDRQVSIIADRLRLAENWLAERRDDAGDFAASPVFRAATGGGPAARSAAQARLAQIQAEHGYAAMCLTLPDGETLAASRHDDRLCPRRGVGGEAIAATQGITIAHAGAAAVGGFDIKAGDLHRGLIYRGKVRRSFSKFHHRFQGFRQLVRGERWE